MMTITEYIVNAKAGTMTSDECWEFDCRMEDLCEAYGTEEWEQFVADNQIDVVSERGARALAFWLATESKW